MSKNINLILSITFIFFAVVLIKTSLADKFVEISENHPEQKGQEDTIDATYHFKQGLVRYEDNSYKFASLLIKDAKNLYLYPNFFEKLTADEAEETYHCDALTSGGMYTMESTPLGLFISEGTKIKSKIISKYFNGLFSVSFDGTVHLGENLDENNIRIALQSGPLLILNGEVYKFITKNEDKARRIVIANTLDNQVLLITFYDGSSVFIGPRLSELPELILKATDNVGVGIEGALNLDGGSASFFKTNEVNLSEIQKAGSFFCLK